MIISNKYLRKLIDAYNRWLYTSRRRIKLITSAEEIPSPKPRMLHRVTYNKIYALAKGMSPTMTISGVTDTNSMEPVIDSGNLALIEDTPNIHDLIVGDIILFYRRLDKARVLHRIVNIGNDSQGWYCETRGDNTVWLDGRVRYHDILGICVGIIY